MTPRERILAAIAHREPDRVPVDQGATRSSGIMAIAYNRLKRHMNIEGGTTFVYDLVQQLARPEPWYLDRFHVDAIDLGSAFDSPAACRPWTLPDGTAASVPLWFHPERRQGALIIRDSAGAIIGRMPDGFICFDQACWPLSQPNGLDDYEPLAEKMQQVTWAALPAPPFDAALSSERLRQIGDTARRVFETTAYAVVLPLGCNLLEWGQFLFGMENFYCLLGSEPGKVGVFLDRLTDLHLEFLHRVLPVVRGYVQVLVFGDDLGTQRGPQISRQMYRRLFLPRHRRMYSCAKQLSGGAHIMLHSCGGLYQLLPDLIEAGVEVLNPVQTTARNMEADKLKKEFGRELTFWGGGCDTQDVLLRGATQQVRDDVRCRLETWMPGGGYVWTQIHNILADVPAGNVVAMLDAAHDYGAY